MARCMLCASTVGDLDVVCPHCGGAVDADGVPAGPPPDPLPTAGSEDPTRVGTFPGPEASPWATPPVLPDSPPLAPPSAAVPVAPTPPASWPVPGPDGPAPHGYTYGPAPVPYGAAPPGDPYGYPYAYPYPYVYGYPYGPPRRPPTEGLAIAGFVTSIAGLVLGFACFIGIVACPVGAVLSQVALRRIAQNGTEGRGLALAGAVIGWIGTSLIVLGIAIWVALVAASA